MYTIRRREKFKAALPPPPPPPLDLHSKTEIGPWIHKHIDSFMWDVNIHPCPNISVAEIRTYMYNDTPLLYTHTHTYIYIHA